MAGSLLSCLTWVDFFPKEILSVINPALANKGSAMEKGLAAYAFIGFKYMRASNTVTYVLKGLLVLGIVLPFGVGADISHNVYHPRLILKNIKLIQKSQDLGTLYSFSLLSRARVESLLEDFDYPEALYQGISLGDSNAWKLYSMVYLSSLFSNAKPGFVLQGDSQLNPLTNHANEGRFLSLNSVLSIEPRFVIENKKFFSLDIWPHISFVDGQKANVSFHQLALKVGYKNLELSIGQMGLNWGQAKYGGLLFNGSQKSLRMIQLQNVAPVDPGFLKFLGEGRFALFVAKLDQNQVRPGSFLIGEKLAFKINANLEIGLVQTIQIGGQGYPDLPWYENASEILGYRFKDDDENFTNRNAVLDFRLRLPKHNDFNIYGEFYFEDCCSIRIEKNLSSLMGIEMPVMSIRRPMNLGFEFLRTTYVYNRHSNYKSGFIYDGIAMGHHVGADSFGFYGFVDQRISQRLFHEWVGAIEIRQAHSYDAWKKDISIRFPSFQTREKRYRMHYGLTMAMHSRWESSLNLGLEWVQGLDFLRDNESWQYMAQWNVRYGF